MKTSEAIEILEKLFETDRVWPHELVALTHAIEHMKRFQWRPISELPQDAPILGCASKNGLIDIIQVDTPVDWRYADCLMLGCPCQTRRRWTMTNLEGALREIRKALELYADPSNYIWMTKLRRDGGSYARHALAKLNTITKEKNDEIMG